MAYVLLGLARVLDIALELYQWVVIVAALITFFSPDPFNPLVRVLRKATEPVFVYIRKWLPFVVVGEWDLSPVVAILVIVFLRIALVGNLTDWAARMR